MKCYTQEILNMMYGFGDSRRPLTETAFVIEEIVQSQMAQLLSLAAEQRRRDSLTIGVEEILFLMRRSPIRIQRLLNYLSIRDTMSSLEEDEEKRPQESLKRVDRCKDFLEKLDTDDSLKDAIEQRLEDDVRTARLQRLDALSRDLDERKYAEFTRARQSNFRGSKFPSKFYEWITKEREDVKISKLALEVLSYLSYEIVGQLVDMALSIRMERSSDDPVTRQMAPLAVNPSFPMVQVPSLVQNRECDLSTTRNDVLANTCPIEPWEIRQVVQRHNHRIGPLGWFYRGEKRRKPCPLFII